MKPRRQEKPSPKKVQAIDENFTSTMKWAGMKRSMTVVSNIYARMKQAWVHARTNYAVFIVEYNKDPVAEQTKTARKQAIRAIKQQAAHGLINISFEGPQAPRQKRLYQAAINYYMQGFGNPSKGYIAKAVLYHKESFDEVNAQAIAVVWALFAMIYNDMDKWLKIMGSKLEIGLKPGIISVSRQAAKRPKITPKGRGCFDEGTSPHRACASRLTP